MSPTHNQSQFTPTKVDETKYTVERGEHVRVRNKYQDMILALKKRIEELERQQDKELYELEQRCTPHEDNGAMFHGFCTRCGACLG